MSARSKATAVATVVVALVAIGLAPGAAAGAQAHASLTDIENDVMCVVCREPLAVAESPQADAERSYIQTLIAQGDTKPQIERELVAQYGPAVLGKPPARGFNLTVYILPPAIVLIGLATLAVTLPRWRRRAREAAKQAPAPAPPPNPADAERLDQELAGFER